MSELSARLAPHYTRFRVAERLLLTGHSHQAWPDVAREGQLEAFDDAAEAVDEKWARANVKADAVRDGLRALLGEPDATIALGVNTHELVVRFLSAVDLPARPRVVTSDAEFHTLRRQLDRLAEVGVEVVPVPATPVETLADRMALEITENTAAALVSSVLFTTSLIVPGLPALAAACRRHGAELLVDAYHALGVVPFDRSGLESAWVVGGGYKYLQLGEGNCFLRLPRHALELRPVVTGWFAEFGDLATPTRPGEVRYAGGAARFAGSTYDPTSHYRAARVFDFFAGQGLTPATLRAQSLRQVGLLAERFDAIEAPPQLIDRDRSRPREAFGGFLSLRTPYAAQLQEALRERGVLTDSRGQWLRFGPAPYLSDEQLVAAMDALAAALPTG
ncbi:hypothetical protein [Pilimelia columellifera]|uniref:Kynureninase n=1 Tax=Pilimelia columellifera subsp. columellifera TaxID=706583 RepID=A0ABN3NJ81_9ACTN